MQYHVILHIHLCLTLFKMLIIRNIIILALLCFYSNFNSIAQSNFTVSYYNGIVLPHHASIAFLTNSYIPGIDYSFQYKKQHPTTHDSLYSMPWVGYGIIHQTLGNKELLGNATHAYSSFAVPWHYYKVHGEFVAKFGLSFAHAPLSVSVFNTALSSSYNFFGSIGFRAYIMRTQHYNLGINVCVSHISNGKTKTPNLGINYAQCGLLMQCNTNAQQATTPTVKQNKASLHRVASNIHIGIKSDNYLSSTRYICHSLQAEYQYRIAPIAAVSLGADAFFDPSSWLAHASDTPPSYSLRYTESGVHIGAILYYNKLSFYVHAGNYTIKETKKPSMYSRIGLQYAINKWFINLSSKNHGATADFIECGLGYYIYTSKKIR